MSILYRQLKESAMEATEKFPDSERLSAVSEQLEIEPATQRPLPATLIEADVDEFLARMYAYQEC